MKLCCVLEVLKDLKEKKREDKLNKSQEEGKKIEESSEDEYENS